MNVLVTGASGFVGTHLVRALADTFAGSTIVGTHFGEEQDSGSCIFLDVTDKDAVRRVIRKAQPEVVFHLAGFSSVGKSHLHPDTCMNVNAGGTGNMLEGVASEASRARVLVVGSAEAYGVPRYLPIDEKHALKPVSPYGASRLEQERACDRHVRERGTHVIFTRSFNHTGPGQPDGFAVSSFAKQIATADPDKPGAVRAGNLDAMRDFSDVRDVVAAYIALIEGGEQGGKYNVCSGKAFQIAALMDMMIAISGKELHVETDPARLRPNDIPVLLGSCEKLIKATGWRRAFTIEDTLRDLLLSWAKTS